VARPGRRVFYGYSVPRSLRAVDFGAPRIVEKRPIPHYDMQLMDFDGFLNWPELAPSGSYIRCSFGSLGAGSRWLCGGCWRWGRRKRPDRRIAVAASEWRDGRWAGEDTGSGGDRGERRVSARQHT
jgi:hypothetical protein